MVFDVGLDIESTRSVTLIELNPWGPPTEAGLFSWAANDFDGSVRTR
ncbi:hypothetical protein CYFUS_005703 [Cystobacter fuscus]|uniref:Cell division cycle protein 123 n=2 Tax=Cystobacter fuscus TaxID=43 RepID=A0A250J8N1_9BACT|nr:hypothetical protein CYFUS_005703 [Cystobacter fuscus]